MKSPIINIFTYQLPFELANQIYNEFQSRFKESNYLIECYKTYGVLRDDIATVEVILALSIFHKRVIASLNGAVKFYNTVSTKSQAEIIKIGSYSLTHEEKNKILAIVINYNKLIDKYSIPNTLMEYNETRQFLRNLIALKIKLFNAESEQDSRREKEEGKDDFPF